VEIPGSVGIVVKGTAVALDPPATSRAFMLHAAATGSCCVAQDPRAWCRPSTARWACFLIRNPLTITGT